MASIRSVFHDTYGRAWNDLTNHGSSGRGQARMPGYQGPGAGYGEPRDEGFTWFSGAGERLLQEHPLDSRGLPTGYRGLLPHTIAPQVQAAHDQAIWEENRRIMQDAVRGARGAAGLLQSFRPGGGAAIESGIYSQIANLQMQRAQMNQPLDVLGDFRREQDAQARRKANRANERALAVQAAAAVGGIAATIATGGAAAPLLGAGISALGTGYAAYQNRQASEAQARAGYDNGQTPRGPSGPGGYVPQPEPAYNAQQPGSEFFDRGEGRVNPATGGVPGGYGPPAPGGPGSSGPIGPGGAQQSMLAPDAPGGPQGQPGAGGSQDSPGGAMGAGGGAVGADGIFDTTAYAADAMRQPVMAHPIVRLVAADTAVNMMEESGLVPTLTFAADRALAKRLAG